MKAHRPGRSDGDQFLRLDIRCGTIVERRPFQARKPAFKLVIDFGAEIGRKKSSARSTLLAPETLVGGR